MPLLPIKDRDGDKEASTAGKQQTDKTNMATMVSESHQAPPHIAPPVESCWKIHQSLPSSIAITYALFTADKEIWEILYGLHHGHSDITKLNGM